MGRAESHVEYERGVEAFRNEHYYLARSCFAHALGEERPPAVCGYLGAALILSGGDREAALALAREGVEREPENPVCYLNLARVLKAADQRDEAIEMLRKGMQAGGDPELKAELDHLGIRRPPPIRFLSRSNPINKYLGLTLSRLGFR